VSVVTGCANCHNGTSATGKTSAHVLTTLGCESCHKSTTTWAGAKVNHSTFTIATNCASCHNGQTATGKDANHFVTTATCGTCHRSYTSWTPAKFHANVSVATGCTNCHGAATYGLTVKPTNHIPVNQLQGGASMDCNTCHTSTTSWASQKMNHNSSMGNGSGWCKSCHATGTAFLGNMEKKALTHDKKTGPTDCSMSGCHKPLGSKGNAYSKWN
jgi:hypothetical protein